MPENAHEIHARAADALRTPDVEEWATWPFEGPVRAASALRPPGARARRATARAASTARPARKPDSDYLWTDDHWRLHGRSSRAACRSS